MRQNLLSGLQLVPASLLALVIWVAASADSRGAGWVTPTGNTDGTNWSNGANARDGSTSTYATNNPSSGWGGWETFSLGAAIWSDRFRVCCDFGYGRVDQIQVDVSTDSVSWATVYTGTVTDASWDTKTFAAQNVRYARFRFHYVATDWAFWLYEFNFYEAPPVINAPTVASTAQTMVEENTAILHGSLTDSGGEPCEVWFEWDTDSGAPYANSTAHRTNLVTGDTFGRLISNGAGGTVYYRAVAMNSAGTSYGSERSFTHSAPGTGWVSPSGYTDSGSAWDNEDDAFDDELATYAKSFHEINDADGQWSPYLILTHASMDCDGVRFYAKQDANIDSAEVDVYDGGSWTNVFSGSFSDKAWKDQRFTRQTVTQARIRFHVSTQNVGMYWELYEFQFHRVQQFTVSGARDDSSLPVTVLVEGVSAGTDSSVAGTYSVSAFMGQGDRVLVHYDDGAAGGDGGAATVATGANLANIDLTTGALIVRNDSASTLTNSDLGAAKGSVADTDIPYTYSGTAVTLSSGIGLTVVSGKTYAPGGTLSLSGSFTNNGTFTHGGSTVTFTGAATVKGSSGTTFYNLAKNAAGALTIGDASASGLTITVSNAFTWTDNDDTVTVGNTQSVTFAIPAVTIPAGCTLASTGDGAISCSGDFINNGTFTHGNGAVTLNASSGTQTVGGTANTTFYNLTLSGAGARVFGNDAAARTFTVVTTFAWSGGNLTVGHAGVADLLNLTAAGAGGDMTVPSGCTLTTVGAAVVNLRGSSGTNGINIPSGATLTLAAGGTSSVACGGNWTNNGTFTPNTSGVTFNGTSAQAVGGAAGTTFYNLTKNTAQALTIGDASAAGLTITASNAFTWTDNDDTITVGNTRAVVFQVPAVTIPAGCTLVTTNDGTLALRGNWDNGGTYTPNQGTVKFNGTGAQTVTTGGSGAGKAFYNLYVDNTAGTPGDAADVDTAGAVKVDGTLTINDGQFQPETGSDLAAVTIGAAGILKPDSSAGITVSGDWANGGTFTANSGTVTFDGATAASGALTGASGQFYSLAVTGSFTPGNNNLAATNSFSQTGGTYTGGSGSLTVAVSFSVSAGTFGGGSGTITVNGAFTQSGGAFTSTSGELVLAGVNNTSTTFAITGGSFAHANGTVHLKASTSNATDRVFTLNFSANPAFYNLRYGGVGNWATEAFTYSLSGTPTVANELRFERDTADLEAMLCSGGTINLSGSLVLNNSTLCRLWSTSTSTTVVNVNGNAAQTYTTDGTSSMPSLTVNTTGSFAPTDGSKNLEALNFVLTAGTFTAPSAEFILDGDLTYNGGTFTHSNGTLHFQKWAPWAGNSTVTVNLNGSTVGLGSLRFGGYGGSSTETVHYQLSAAGKFTVAGTLTIQADSITTGAGSSGLEYIYVDQGNVELSGNLVVGQSAYGGSATVTALGNTAQTYKTVESGAGFMCALTVNTTGSFAPDPASGADFGCSTFNLAAGAFTCPTGVFTVTAGFTVAGGAAYTHNDGTLSLKLLVGWNSSATMTVSLPAGLPVKHLRYGGLGGSGTETATYNVTAGSFAAAGDFTVQGHDATLDRLIMTGGSVDLSGNFIVDSVAFSGSTTTLNVVGNAPQTYKTTGAGTPSIGPLALNTSGSFAPTADSGANLNITNFTQTAGAFTAPTGTLADSGSFTVSAGTFTHNSGTVTFTATSGTKTITSGGQAFHNVIFGTAAGATWQLQDALSAANDFTFAYGTFQTNDKNVTVDRDMFWAGTLGANAFKAGAATIEIKRTFDWRRSSVMLAAADYGTSQFRLTGTGSMVCGNDNDLNFWNLHVAAAGQTVTFNGSTANTVVQVVGQVTTGTGTFEYTNNGANFRLYPAAAQDTPFYPDVACLWKVPFTLEATNHSLTKLYGCNLQANVTLYRNVNSAHEFQLMRDFAMTGNLTAYENQGPGSVQARTILMSGFNLGVTGNLSLGSGTTPRAYTVNVSSGTLTVSGNLTAVGTTNHSTKRILDMNGGTAVIGGDFTHTGYGEAGQKVYMAGGSTLRVGGNWATSAYSSGAIFSLSGTNLVKFDGNDAAGVNHVATEVWPNVEVAGSLVTMSQNLSCAGLTVSSGSLDMNAKTLSCTSLAQTGGTFTGSTNSLAVSGTFSLSGGTFNSTSGTLTVGSAGSGAITATFGVGNTFVPGTGASTVAFYLPNMAALTEVGAVTFNNLTITNSLAGSSWKAFSTAETLTVDGTLTLHGYQWGSWNVSLNGGGTLVAKGPVVGNSRYVVSNTSTFNLTIGGDGAQTQTDLYLSLRGNYTVNKPTGTLTYSGDNRWIGGADAGSLWTMNLYFTTPTDFTTNTTTALLEMSTNSNFGSQFNIYGAPTFHNLTMTRGAGTTGNTTLNLQGNTVTVNNTFTDSMQGVAGWYGIINNGTIDCKGAVNMSAGNYYQYGTGVIRMSGSADSALTPPPTYVAGLLYPLVVAKDAGKKVTVSTSPWRAGRAGSYVTVASGMLDLAGLDLATNGALTVTDSLRLQGGETVTRGSLDLQAGSTVEYTGAGTYTSFPAGLGNSYRNLTISGSGSWTPAAAVTVAEDLGMSAGTYVVDSTRSLTVTGGTALSGTATLQLAAGSTLGIGDGSTLTSAVGSTFRVAGTAGSPAVIKNENDGAGFCEITLSGVVDVSHAEIRHLAANCLTLGGADATEFSNVTFLDGEEGGGNDPYLKIESSAWAGYVFEGVSFEKVDGRKSVQINTSADDQVCISYYSTGDTWLSGNTSDLDTDNAGGVGHVQWAPTAAVGLAARAERKAKGVEVAWSALSERGTVGYTILRRPVPAGAPNAQPANRPSTTSLGALSSPKGNPQPATWKKLVEVPAAVFGGEPSGSEYRWLDESAGADGRFEYRVEEIEADRRTTVPAAAETSVLPPESGAKGAASVGFPGDQ